MRSLLIVVAVSALVIPLALQAQQGGVTAQGWEVRLDRGTDATGVLNFMTMGSGVHATTAGAGGAIFWQPNSMSKGTYSISASFTQAEPSNHPNAYGLFFGGSDLAGSGQRYSYFVIRENGEFLIRKRMGGETPDVAFLDWARCHQRGRRTGTGDEHADGGGWQRTGAFPGERRGSVDSAALGLGYGRDHRAACEPLPERSHRQPRPRYVSL